MKTNKVLKYLPAILATLLISGGITLAQVVAIPQETTQSVTDTLPVYAIPEPTVEPIDVLSATPAPQVPATPSFEVPSPMSSSHAVNVDDTEIRVLLQQIIALLTEIIKLSK